MNKNDGPTAAALTDISGANSTLHGSEYEYDNSTLDFDDGDGNNSTDDELASPFDNPVIFYIAHVVDGSQCDEFL